jgi:hypothetical protein
MLLRIGSILLGAAIIAAGLLLMRHRDAASQLAQRTARSNLIFGRRLADQNASRQTPALMVAIGLIWILTGAVLAWRGIAGTVR